MTKIFDDSYLIYTCGIVIFTCFQQTKNISPNTESQEDDVHQEKATVNTDRLRPYFSVAEFEELVEYDREIMCAQLDRYQQAVRTLGEICQGICRASVFLWCSLACYVNK